MAGITMSQLGEKVDHLEKRFDNMQNRVDAIDERLMTLERMAADVSSIADNAEKALTWLKRGLPLVATAAVTSGIVSGRWGDFIVALFSH